MLYRLHMIRPSRNLVKQHLCDNRGRDAFAAARLDFYCEMVTVPGMDTEPVENLDTDELHEVVRNTAGMEWYAGRGGEALDELCARLRGAEAALGADQ